LEKTIKKMKSDFKIAEKEHDTIEGQLKLNIGIIQNDLNLKDEAHKLAEDTLKRKIETMENFEGQLKVDIGIIKHDLEIKEKNILGLEKQFEKEKTIMKKDFEIKLEKLEKKVTKMILEKFIFDYPKTVEQQKPEFSENYNIAVIGRSGMGKSTLINDFNNCEYFQDTPNPPHVAKTGIHGQCTTVMSDYNPGEFFKSDDLRKPIKFWDVPGMSTSDFTKGKYIADFGLKWFDLIIIVQSGSHQDDDDHLIREMIRTDTPYFCV
jgi:hypothetical protein